MGFKQFVKSVICRLRETGKTESEIWEILKDAAEKSTVNRTRVEEREPETVVEPRYKQNDAMDSMCYALVAAGITAKEALTALEAMRAKPRHETNNWRRMHNIPMKRKHKRRTSRRGKRKRTDSGANNAEMA